jgi:hypothetical protein
MAYRGDDLDLRTPQGWSNSPRDSGRETGGNEPNWWTRTAVYKGGRSDPIWVDDNVMACCNHAFDLAVAHRSQEVRLEHLINALTLSDAAAQVLEARGLGVASLRRESGAAIANEMLSATGNGQVVPKRSEAMVEALRLAADNAYPRRTPVTVDDLLQVLFGMKRDIPGVQLLHRHAASWSGRNGSDYRLEPLPQLSRPQTYSQPRPRFASQQAHDYFNQPVREPMGSGAREPLTRELVTREPQMPSMPLPPREMPQPATMVDTFQDTRIDSLERAVRDLGIDLADDRKTIRSLVGDLQRTAAMQADDTGRFRGNLSDRLGALEDTLVRSRNETSQLPSALLDRMGGIERSVEARMSDLARMPAVPQVLVDRLANIERSLEARLVDLSRANSVVADRMLALEAMSQRPVEATLSPLVLQRMEAITAFSSKVETLEQTFQLILDRMTGVERKMAAVSEVKAVDLEPLQARFASFERQIEKEPDLSPVTDLLSGIETRVAGVERSLENRTAETGRTVSFIGERLRAFEEAIGGQKTQTVERLGQIERSITAYAESAVNAGSSHGQDLAELHEALIKLNTNQQTLANSLEQWRQDNIGDLSIINNRLKTIEETENRQNPMVDHLSAQINAIHSTLAKREARKSRFRNWLFGTNEWYTSSYHTQNWRARQSELPVLRPTGETVTIQQRPTPPAPPPSMARR